MNPEITITIKAISNQLYPGGIVFPYSFESPGGWGKVIEYAVKNYDIPRLSAIQCVKEIQRVTP